MAINSLWRGHCNSLEYADYGNSFCAKVADRRLWHCNSLEYADYGNSSVARVRFVLMKLDSDYKHTTDYFGHKFMSKVEAIFSGLPKPKEWRSFFINDLPLLTSIDEDVQQIATADTHGWWLQLSTMGVVFLHPIITPAAHALAFKLNH